MKYILLVNALIEILGGFILIFNPQLLLSHANPELQGVVISKLYGIMIFSFGILTYLLFKSFSYTKMYKQIILLIICIHFAIGLYMYGVYQQALTPHPGAAATHIIVAVAMMLVYLKNNHNFDHGESIA
jgi:hypothetical protein